MTTALQCLLTLQVLVTAQQLSGGMLAVHADLEAVVQHETVGLAE